MKWYGHVTRASGLAKTVLQGTVRGGRRRGRPRKQWEDNIRDWMGLKLSDAMRRAEEREEHQGKDDVDSKELSKWKLIIIITVGKLNNRFDSKSKNDTNQIKKK